MLLPKPCVVTNVLGDSKLVVNSEIMLETKQNYLLVQLPIDWNLQKFKSKIKTKTVLVLVLTE